MGVTIGTKKLADLYTGLLNLQDTGGDNVGLSGTPQQMNSGDGMGSGWYFTNSGKFCVGVSTLSSISGNPSRMKLVDGLLFEDGTNTHYLYIDPSNEGYHIVNKSTDVNANLYIDSYGKADGTKGSIILSTGNNVSVSPALEVKQDLSTNMSGEVIASKSISAGTIVHQSQDKLVLWVNSAASDDTKDGTSYANAKKTLDALLDQYLKTGVNLEIRLVGDRTKVYLVNKYHDAYNCKVHFCGYIDGTTAYTSADSTNFNYPVISVGNESAAATGLPAAYDHGSLKATYGINCYKSNFSFNFLRVVSPNLVAGYKSYDISNDVLQGLLQVPSHGGLDVSFTTCLIELGDTDLMSGGNNYQRFGISMEEVRVVRAIGSGNIPGGTTNTGTADAIPSWNSTDFVAGYMKEVGTESGSTMYSSHIFRTPKTDGRPPVIDKLDWIGPVGVHNALPTDHTQLTLATTGNGFEKFITLFNFSPMFNQVTTHLGPTYNAGTPETNGYKLIPINVGSTNMQEWFSPTT